MTDLVPDQAERIYKLLEASFKMTIETAIEIGEALTEQKAAMKHGEFGPWVEANLPVSKQMARKYMRVYACRDEIRDAPNLTTAYQRLAKGNLGFLLPSPTPKPKPEPEVIDTEGETVPEPEVIETPSEDVPPEDPGPLLDTSDVDTEGEEVQDAPSPVAPKSNRLSVGAAGVAAKTGLQPVNWEKPEVGWELTPEQLAKVAETIGYLKEEWVPEVLARLSEHPDEMVREGAGKGLENHEAEEATDALPEEATDVPQDALKSKRAAIPADWVEVLYDLHVVEPVEGKVKGFLMKVLEKFQGTG